MKRCRWALVVGVTLIMVTLGLATRIPSIASASVSSNQAGQPTSGIIKRGRL